MEPIHVADITAINAQSMGSDITGTPVDVTECITYAIQADWSAGSTPIGNMLFYGSNKGVIYTQFATIPVSGNSGSDLLNVERVGYNWVRVDYQRTSGSGTLTATVNTKRN